jgi:hypothetical protein
MAKKKVMEYCIKKMGVDMKVAGKITSLTA